MSLSPGPAVAIRIADPADAAAISALLESLLPQVVDEPDAPLLAEFRDSLGIAATTQRLASPEFAHLLAEDAEGACGFIAIRNNRHLYHLFIRNDMQRRGIAQALWRAALARHGSGRYTVNASPNAVGFYERLGFRPTAAEQFANGLRFLPMAFEP